jgi:hypothetical protein
LICLVTVTTTPHRLLLNLTNQTVLIVGVAAEAVDAYEVNISREEEGEGEDKGSNGSRRRPEYI